MYNCPHTQKKLDIENGDGCEHEWWCIWGLMSMPVVVATDFKTGSGGKGQRSLSSIPCLQFHTQPPIAAGGAHRVYSKPYCEAQVLSV